MAVGTHNLAVGNSVPFVFARLGAGVSQLETNPQHATAIARALGQHGDARRALSEALANDAEFRDGAGLSLRQVAVAAFRGKSAAHTGKDAGDWAGHQTHRGWTVQGNGLAGPEVLSAMSDAFQKTRGPLAHRLLSALEAGRAAGGQRIGIASAAVKVAHPDGWPLDTDLRVDLAPGTAIQDLRRAYDAHRARIFLNRARWAMKKNPSKAATLVERAVQLAPTWDRIWLGALQLTAEDQVARRKRYRCRFAELNPAWAKQMPLDTSGCKAKTKR